MRVLLVAPHPFFQERGTPIAVRMLCETLCDAGHSIDLLTYHVGQNVHIPGLSIHRIPAVPFIRAIPIGFSWRKLVCDVVLAAKLLGMVRRNNYDVIHAVEESIFPALIARRLSRAKLVYDMDSSIADQLLASSRFLAPLRRPLYLVERWAIRGADSILAVCDELAVRARACDPDKHVAVLRDVPLEGDPDAGPAEDLRTAHRISGLLMLYVGNLERYQGIDLLLEAFAQARPRQETSLVIIGGHPAAIARYRGKTEELGIAGKVHFLGPRPLTKLPEYLRQASILVSPRLTGNNTPMKVYSYLASGKPVLATNISAHTQIMDSTYSLLVDPVPEAMARGIEALATDEALRARLGSEGASIVQRKYSRSVFKKTVVDEYSHLEQEMLARAAALDSSS